MMTEVIQYQAMDITASDYETFDECADRIVKATHKRLRYKDPDNPANPDGILIEIDPNAYQSFNMFELTRLGTPEEYMTLFNGIMLMVKQMEETGQLPKDWVKRVATPFNTKCPKIPEHFADDIPGAVVKAYLTGTAEITLVRILPPPVPMESEEEE
jgi:hypothetical protein